MKTTELTKQFLNGEYNIAMENVPIFKIKAGNKNQKELQSKTINAYNNDDKYRESLNNANLKNGDHDMMQLLIQTH